MTPNLYTLNVKDIHISGYLYVDEQVMWNQDTVQAKVNKWQGFWGNITFELGHNKEYICLPLP